MQGTYHPRFKNKMKNINAFSLTVRKQNKAIYFINFEWMQESKKHRNGLPVGTDDGNLVGHIEGKNVGKAEGRVVGTKVGIIVGLKLGFFVGVTLGTEVG